MIPFSFSAVAAKAPRKVLGSSGGGGAGTSNVASPSSSGANVGGGVHICINFESR